MKKLNPALLDSSSEFFNHEKTDRHLINGMVSRKNELPGFFSSLIHEEITKNETIKKCLDDMGLKNPKKRVMQYYQCNYSVFDEKPDVTSAGRLGPREYVQCARRGTCPHEGRLCLLPMGLTKKEIEVLKLIGQGMLDKEICSVLNISKDTIRKHKDHISAKAGIERKASLAVLAFKLNLI